MRHFKVAFFTFFILNVVFGQNFKDPLISLNAKAQEKWVDSVYNSLTLKEKVGQLYTIQVFSKQDEATKKIIIDLIKDYQIGGVIYSKGDPVSQANLDNELQKLSKIPLLVSMDAEWGLNMRLDSTFAFPWNMTLGAIDNNQLIEQVGKHIGEHCKRLGVHLNFAPVVDINTNPKNPIIGNRSFGEDRDNVTNKALAFMKGMQSVGVLGNAKHFPGHGDTDSDSHKTLPTINFDAKRIDSVELYPYKKLIKEGLSSVMVAHLNVPSLETQGKYPSSLSKHIVTNILKDSLKFQGLIISDALSMKGAADFNESGEIDLAAFMAGNDILLMSENPSIGINKIVDAYYEGKISEYRLEYSVKKILKAKFKVGLNQYKPIATKHLVEDLNRIKDHALYEELIENAITVVKNTSNILPLRRLETKTIAYVKMGDDDGTPFFEELKKYGKVHEVKAKKLDELLNKLQSYNTVIIGFHRSNASPWKSFEISDQELVWLYEIARTHTLILDVFVKPYVLSDFKSIENIESIIVSYQNSDIAQQKSAQLIFGAIPSKGNLPVSTGDFFKAGDGIHINDLERLSYTIPERAGMSSKKMEKIDSVAQYAIKNRMTPGIQLLVARKGKVIYHKNFGKHTYEGQEMVTSNDIYDVASLTKILATLPLLMELEEQGIVNLDTKLSQILPEYKNSNKAKITLKQMLSHYARLAPWIPFYVATLDSVTKKPSAKYYRSTPSSKFNLEVAKGLYLRADYQDSMQFIVKESKLLDRLKYRYSDLPYYILKKFIETHYDKPLDALIQDHFYESLGANLTLYNPYHKISNKNIVPTEIDDYYRNQEIHGYVHDMGAAMQNGVGGHAGIFSNANDVAKIMQMYLQKGFYGGKRYLKPETIDKFNTCYFCNKDNRRGIGFDKPQLQDEGPTCGCVSMASFGHSGFTGTYAWADPEKDIVYVFLANRTYPSAGKNLLLKENIRTVIQRLIYEAIED
ncbi:MAG: serine hydrolase [Flavobacteriales bacterium]|nr:serine hydrolase [Flavobacteriia bacterium]NCP05735.1 serine hydrolase [Flavobacteriales bacterium]PIV94535.1 MAG: beta-N-acetylglucosaminidase [Flavobacteriaceae bacterium CG17_big_fil_post_rev_8_21_14_2_50_33_15]PIY10678.1 MAG: beta-N-acetylglucosaminidase [Flavobacteriaceae bacterium CG_4_10_14_3_um_filter_33_47]PJB18142.1 MAG: beta-N-acetylglucosaminidase [Flavobacteriaceae bacterium CG_4_9_14_3_um_filter_33_16]